MTTHAATPLLHTPRAYAPLLEAARYACTSRSTLTRRIAEGKLRSYRNGKQILIDLNELDRMLEEGAK